jgi:lipoprotein signal peptidase
MSGRASGDRGLLLLRIACALLPRGIREEQMREWRDEIQCARRDGRKVLDGSLGRRLPKYFRQSWALTAGRADRTRALAVASLVLLIDLGSKAVVTSSVTLFERAHPLPHLTIFHLHNPGLSLTFIDGGFYMPVAVAHVVGSVPAVFNFADLAIALAVLLAALPRSGRSRPAEGRSFQNVAAESPLL